MARRDLSSDGDTALNGSHPCQSHTRGFRVRRNASCCREGRPRRRCGDDSHRRWGARRREERQTGMRPQERALARWADPTAELICSFDADAKKPKSRHCVRSTSGRPPWPRVNASGRRLPSESTATASQMAALLPTGEGGPEPPAAPTAGAAPPFCFSFFIAAAVAAAAEGGGFFRAGRAARLTRTAAGEERTRGEKGLCQRGQRRRASGGAADRHPTQSLTTMRARAPDAAAYIYLSLY